MFLAVQQNPLTQPQDPSTVALTGRPLMILLLAVVLAWPASIILLKLYRRAVLTSMRATSKRGTLGPMSPDTSAPPRGPTQTIYGLSATDHAPSVTQATAEGLNHKLLRAPWRAVSIYVIAGFCYALVMTVATLASWQSGFPPLRFLSVLWVHAWPVVLTVGLVAAATRRAKLATAAAYSIVLAVLGAVAALRGSSPALAFASVFALWGLANLPATLLLWAFLNRKVRAVGPLVLTFMVLALLGSELALAAAGSNEGLLRSLGYLGSALKLGGVGTFLGLIALGFTVSGVVGWLVLRWIGLRYERKKVSDQSVTLDSVWLLFGMVQSIPLLFGGAVWILSGFLAFAAYKLVSWAGFSLTGRGAVPADRSDLLLLRVFSLGKRSERLFDALAKHWRFVGSIRLIAGPDLATTTVEPHEFLDFLGGNLARRFIDGPETLNRRMLEMDLEPDWDGRFRVNDFFCYQDTWRMALSRLVADDNAVLMDLRGYSARSEGVSHEICELINVVPLRRVVLVADNTTDGEYLRQVVQGAWDNMRPGSPNRSASPEQLPLFRFTGAGGELRRLLNVLCDAAEPTSPRERDGRKATSG